MDSTNSLHQFGHEAINIWNIKERPINKPVSMFFVDLKIHNAALRKPHNIPQSDSVITIL